MPIKPTTADMMEELRHLDTAIKAGSRHWFKRWFVPSSLLSVDLSNFDHANALAICLSFEKSYKKTWFFQRWLFPIFYKFKMGSMMNHYRFIKQLGLLETLLKMKDLRWWTPVSLVGLSETPLLSGKRAKENFVDVCNHKLNESVSTILVNLSNAGLLATDPAAQTNFDNLLNYYRRNPVHTSHEEMDLERAVNRLSQNLLLTGQHGQANFNALLENPPNACETAAESLVASSKKALPSGPHADFFPDRCIQPQPHDNGFFGGREPSLDLSSSAQYNPS